eukprot:TRINITY_DN18608_c0_g1_i1.p1 TRINITY_DN18608_c0_g1~~TRINITY_DN18608_c0_g1_i1.p1  ORF type:complete len:106 (-),score=28.34 TRINITY_DN18608_c0_g1_i1:201-518(-)
MSLFCFFFFFLMIRRPPRSTLSSSSAASDVYKRQVMNSLKGPSGHDPQLAAEDLTKHCIFNLKSSDNVSVVIIVPRKLNCRAGPLSFVTGVSAQGCPQFNQFRPQ